MRKQKSKTIVASVTLFLFVGVLYPLQSLSYPEGTGNLKGFIYKANSKTPLWGAQVLLKDVKTGKLYESNVTDAVGDYKLLEVPAGDYMILILVKDKSYKIKKVDFLIKIVEGKTTHLSFSLKKSRGLLIFLPPCILKAIIVGAIAFLVKTLIKK